MIVYLSDKTGTESDTTNNCVKVSFAVGLYLSLTVTVTSNLSPDEKPLISNLLVLSLGLGQGLDPVSVFVVKSIS